MSEDPCGSLSEHTMLCRSGVVPCHEKETDAATRVPPVRLVRSPAHHHRRHRLAFADPGGPVRRIGWGHAIAFTILVTCLWVSGIVMSGVRAAEPPPGLVLSRHLVVQSSSLPACTFNDGTDGPRPCGWNLPGPGLAYWVGTGRHLHYVWGRTPHPIRTGAAHWATRAEARHLDIQRSCWVKHPRLHRYTFQCPGDGAPS